MKKILPELLYVFTVLAVILVAIVVLNFAFAAVSNWWYVAIAGIIYFICPKYQYIDTQSGKRLQVKWMFFSKPKHY